MFNAEAGLHMLHSDRNPSALLIHHHGTMYQIQRLEHKGKKTKEQSLSADKTEKTEIKSVFFHRPFKSYIVVYIDCTVYIRYILGPPLRASDKFTQRVFHKLFVYTFIVS